MNLVTPKAEAKCELLFNKPASILPIERWVCRTSKSDLTRKTNSDQNHICDNYEFANT
jgi:hypothetical protein